MSNYITKLEGHADLEVSIIRATKINKVLKAIIKLDSIPKDEEYQFRRRSIDILAKWKNLLESDVPPAGAEAKNKESRPKPNGVHRQSDTVEGGDDDSTTKAVENKSDKPVLEALETTAPDQPMSDADQGSSAAVETTA
jgi:hypothetical protein